MGEKPIFFDTSNKRKKRAKRIFYLFGSVLFFSVTIFIISLFLHPVLPLPGIFHDLSSLHHFHKPKNPPPIVKDAPLHRAPFVSTASGKIVPEKRKVYAFGVEWDDASFASLQANKEKMDALIMEELTLKGTGMSLIAPDQFGRTLTYLKNNDPDLPVHALINNFNQSTNLWDTKLLFGILKDDTERKNLEENLLDFTKKYNLSGINIDFEELDDGTFPYYLTFLSEFSQLMHESGKIVSVNVPLGNDSYDLEEISNRVDLIFLMAYDEHWSNDDPGPIASNDWFVDGVKTALSQVPSEKLIVTLGNYGYDWTLGKKESDALTFQEAHTIMKESDANIDFDQESMNPMFAYLDDNNKEHEVWYLDGVTGYNELASIEDLGIGNISLWRLGSEDPSIWNIFKQKSGSGTASSLSKLEYGYEINYDGDGEFYKLQSDPKEGARKLSLSGNLITDETISDFPLPYTISQYGDKKDKKIALTFDDGPSSEFTPKILDILKQEKVPATFFMVGENIQKFPNLVSRAYSEGNIIGNHSYSHPDISKIGSIREDFELVSTERLIESITGHRSIIFRPPYAEDIEPEIPSEVGPLEESKNLGYITVGMKIDPNDWANPGVDKIVQRTIDGAETGNGNIVLLHDAGGDRSETVQALPIIIEKLKALGYTFVGINDLLGNSRDDIMPKVSGNDAVLQDINHTSFSYISILLWILYDVFITTLLFSVVRLLIVIIFAFLEKYHHTPKRVFHKKNISVSIIVPAYNEAKVIEKTIDSLLLSNYPNFNIIIVDDGSTDNTIEIVKNKYGKNPQIQLLSKKNSGKGESMNYGIEHTSAEVVIVIDADTIFAVDTIGLLTRHFSDPKVGAVAGNVKVGNRENLLTNMQALEYNTSQNLDRRAYSALHAITIVPGAIGAWRRKVILQLGGFSGETLAEDSDMTITLLRAGYEIRHEEGAYAYTEVPSNWKGFAKQRFRWGFGVLQVTWKHIDALFTKETSGILRFFIFPSFLIFQIIVPLIAPLFDLFTIILFIINIISYSLYGTSMYLNSLFHVILYSLLFLIFDFCITCIAISFEKDENWKILKYFLPQRFLYRFFMYYIGIKALWSALKGSIIGWGKLERSGTVSIKK